MMPETPALNTLFCPVAVGLLAWLDAQRGALPKVRLFVLLCGSWAMNSWWR